MVKSCEIKELANMYAFARNVDLFTKLIFTLKMFIQSDFNYSAQIK